MAFGSIRILTPLSSTTSSVGPTASAYSIVYSIPAQPPFFTPTRTPAMGLPACAITDLMRNAAASVSRITWGLGRGVVITSSSHHMEASDCRLPHMEHKPGFVRHPAGVPRRIPNDLHLGLLHTGNARHSILDHDRQVLRRRTVRRRERHVDFYATVVADIDLVNQPQLIDVGGDFRIVNGFQRRNDVIGQLVKLVRRKRRRAGDRRGLRRFFRSWLILGRIVGHAKNSRAFTSEAARVSTSSLVLYIENEARHVAVNPKRASRGITHCVPARIATPPRSMIVATS